MTNKPPNNKVFLSVDSQTLSRVDWIVAPNPESVRLILSYLYPAENPERFVVTDETHAAIQDVLKAHTTTPYNNLKEILGSGYVGPITISFSSVERFAK